MSQQHRTTFRESTEIELAIEQTIQKKIKPYFNEFAAYALFIEKAK